MKRAIILILTLISIIARGQEFVGKYHDYHGHGLELKKDSTFRFDWYFDMIHDWATGRWTASGKKITLEFIEIYDTLSRQGKPDSLVLSIDEKSDKISDTEFTENALVSGGQHKYRFNDKFFKRLNRLYIVKKNGRLNRKKFKGIWPQKKWPWGYKKWPTFYMKES